MRSVFVSVPMKGKSYVDIKRMQLDLFSMVATKDMFLIDSVRIPNKDDEPLSLLVKSLELLAEADVVVFAPYYADARGCRIEHRICHEYNKPHIHIGGVE